MIEHVSQDHLLVSPSPLLASCEQCGSAICELPTSRVISHNTHPVFKTASVVSLVVGSLVLVGWVCDIELFKAVVPGLASMKVNAAIAFECLGLSMLLLSFRQRHHCQLLLAQTAAIGAILLGGATLVEYRFECDLGIDEWFIRDE